jgi:hypothetical protein
MQGWSGGGIGNALKGAGAAVAAGGTQAASTVAKTAAENAVKDMAAGAAKDAAYQTALKKAMVDELAKASAGKGWQGFVNNASNAGKGIGSLFSSGTGNYAGAIGSNIGMAKGATALGTIGMPTTPAGVKGDVTQKPEFYVTSYNPGTRNPNWAPGNGEPYFIGQGYGPSMVTQNKPFNPTYESYDKKGNPIGAAGISPVEMMQQLNAQQQQQQQPIPVHAADGGSLDDYMNSVNADNAGVPGLQAYKPLYASSDRFSGHMFDNMGGFGGMMGMSGMRGGNTGYGLSTTKYNPTTGTYFADGGSTGGIESLGAHSDGGRLLQGPGDGVSDDIPARIFKEGGDTQEARLATGEFVFPARIVSEIGNGSTEAGAQRLYAAMDKIQQDRSRTIKDVALDTNAIRHVEALA